MRDVVSFCRVVDFVGAHPQLSFVAVFLLALSEAVPVIGTVLPGSTLILAISALATAAGITPWGLVVAAVAGAIVGDGFSFWLGRRYHRQILRGWPLNRFPGLVERSALSNSQIWHRERVPGAFHGSCARVCPLAGWHAEHVVSPFLFGQRFVGPGLGADARFAGVLVGFAVAMGGAHAPELTLAAMGALILVWIAWSIIERKTVALVDRAGGQEGSGSTVGPSATGAISVSPSRDTSFATLDYAGDAGASSPEKNILHIS